MKSSARDLESFQKYIQLTDDEILAFQGTQDLFSYRTTPYYLSLVGKSAHDPIRKIVVPHKNELSLGTQSEEDPLGEVQNQRTSRIIHRYHDRVLFLVTDFCSVYCRYCTRKHFTGHEQAFAKEKEYSEALKYIQSRPGIREVILSGGDPLTLSDEILDRVLTDLRAIEHVEIIRIGTRMPVVCPMRITDSLVQIFRKHKPVFVMTHFNHPRELTREAAMALELLVDHGVPVFNQMVLLRGVNNHQAIVQALSRRLLFLRVKPYYMFQCDPSVGTDHFRTSIEESLEIQAQLWGKLSGLAMPTLSLDIPNGGGKTTLVPDFELSRSSAGRVYQGFDGVRAEYKNPAQATGAMPIDYSLYQNEWHLIERAKD